MEPKTNKEMFLAKAAGEYDGDLPEPVTREEQYLAKIAEGGSGGDSYTKAETDTLLAGKADVGDLTTQDEATDDIYIGDTPVIVYLTQSEYEALDPPETQVLYVILEDATPQTLSSNSPSLSMVNPQELREFQPTIDEVIDNEYSEGLDSNR